MRAGAPPTHSIGFSGGTATAAGSSSSSRVVPVASPEAMSELTGDESLTTNVSSGSYVSSSTMSTDTVALDSRGAKVNVPETDP